MCSFQPRPTSWSGRAPRGWLTGGRPRQCQTQPPTWVFCEREAANKAGRATANRRLLPYIPLAPFAPKAQKLTISRLGIPFNLASLGGPIRPRLIRFGPSTWACSPTHQCAESCDRINFFWDQRANRRAAPRHAGMRCKADTNSSTVGTATWAPTPLNGDHQPSPGLLLIPFRSSWLQPAPVPQVQEHRR
jgi:hypothetical protein